MFKLKVLLFKIILFPLKIIQWAKINNLYTMVIKGKDSHFYEETSIQNHSLNPDNIIIKNNSHIRGELLIFKHGGKIEIGDNSFIGVGSKIWSGESIKIGNNVLISHNVNIIDTNSHEINHIEREEGFKNLIKNGYSEFKGSILTAPIIVEDNVWINFNVIILKGVIIGEGAIVAAGSIVTKNVEPYTMVAGNPARFIKNLQK
jgi:acetyltransferase-like isoleucine patch superfamily enzyme